MDGEFVTSLDDSSDSEFVGPTLDMLDSNSGPSSMDGIVLSGDLASTASTKTSSSPSDNYGIVTWSDLTRANPAVPGVATKTNGADAGIGFASLVSNLGAITKTGADIASKVAPQQTKKVLARVPGMSGTVPAPASSGPSLGTFALVGGALLGVGLLVALVKG
jgi:hypothetical protein